MSIARSVASTSLDRRALETRVAELEELVAALRSGGVDALVIGTDDGPCVRPVAGSDVVYGRLFEQLPEGVAALSLDGRILLASKRFAALLGVPSDELIGRGFIEFVAHDDRAAVDSAFHEHRPDDVRLLVDLDAACTQCATVVISIEGIERRGQTTRWVIVSDVDHQAHLRYLVDHDHLTGLLNRRGFDALLEEHRGFSKSSGAILIVDVDEFKAVNDRLGHTIGDQLLMQLAHGLSASVRGDDVIARHGGDEFAILMRSGDYAAASALASRLLANIRNLQLGAALELGQPITVSVGGAVIKAGGHTFVAADEALYQAKRAGRDTAVIIGGDASDVG